MELAVDHRTAPLSAPPSRSQALRDVLAELGERVKPVVLARERTMPVAAPFDQVFPAGLVRGQVVACLGGAAGSLAFGLVRDALVAGAWLAVVDVDAFGADAAAEFGLPLERVVRIETGAVSGPGAELDWIDVMGAAIDGFDVVLTRTPSALAGDRRPAAVRKLASRLQQKGSVVITLGSSGALTADAELHTQRTVWGGLEAGAGHLRRRLIDIEVTGRRIPGTRRCSMALSGVGNRIEFGMAPVGSESERDPQAELLEEMVGATSPVTGSVTGSVMDSVNGVVVTDLAARRLAG